MREPRNKVLQGDCLEVMKGFPDNYFDALISDPPAGIAFMGKDWDKHRGGMINWVNWMSEVMAEAVRVMKPGAIGLVWSIPRTSHWTGMALDLAGLRIIDVIHHCQGSGFPKGQDIGKLIDKMAGAEREVVGHKINSDGRVRSLEPNQGKSNGFSGGLSENRIYTAPATPEAQQWDGWKTPALKPAVEGWWLVQKPISESSIARNILTHGTGGLNIEAGRVESEPSLKKNWNRVQSKSAEQGRNAMSGGLSTIKLDAYAPSGRYPSNLILSCGSECDGDRHAPDCPVEVIGAESRYFKQLPFDPDTVPSVWYQAKAAPSDRSCGGKVQNVHPTVKSRHLMAYFCKLITPPGGVILDPFGGSGSTALGAIMEGFDYCLIEQDPDYLEVIKQRIATLEPEPSQPTLEERVQWLETQVQAQGNKIKKLEKQRQLSIFNQEAM